MATLPLILIYGINILTHFLFFFWSILFISFWKCPCHISFLHSLNLHCKDCLLYFFNILTKLYIFRLSDSFKCKHLFVHFFAISCTVLRNYHHQVIYIIAKMYYNKLSLITCTLRSEFCAIQLCKHVGVAYFLLLLLDDDHTVS